MIKTSSEQNELVSVIIPYFNGKNHLSKLVKSLENQTYRKIEVIIVDNNSSDGSIDMLKSIGKKIIPFNVILKNENGGYCGGCNEGIKFAKGDYLLFLSQDRIMNDDWIEKTVVKINQDIKVGCVVGKVIREGASTAEFGHSYDIYGAVLINGTSDESKLFFGGGTVLIKKSVIDEIGGFDSDFFIYQEDVDICWRMRLAGYQIKIEESAICFNEGGGISDTFFKNEQYNITFDSELINMPLYKFYYSQKNRIRTLLKNYSLKNIVKRLPIVILMILLRGIFMSVKTKKISYFFSVFNGYWWNISHIVNTIKVRKKIQQLRKVTDKEIELYMLTKSIEISTIKSLKYLLK